MTTKQINDEIQEMKELGNSTGKISDGYHTFDELYEHRAVLTAALFRQLPFTWKSKKHDDEENNPMYEGMFIVGVTTPDGFATYHYDWKDWDMFRVPEIPHAPEFDGHTPNDVIHRLKKYFTRGTLIYSEEEMINLSRYLDELLECFDTDDEKDIYLRTFLKYMDD